MLTVIKGLLEATAAKELVDALSGAPFVDGAATAQGATKTVKHSLQLPVEHALSQKLGRVILARLNTSDAFKAAAVPHTILPLRFCRYDVDMAYGTHLDLPIMGTPSGSIRTDLSMTVFLTDPNDYDGGVLVFESEYGTKSVRGAAGDAVIYPSSLLHRVEPVTRGSRMVAISWMQSMVRDPAARKILFDIVQVASKLEQTAANSPESLLLRQAHYNLLRMWADQ
ncbi:MAG: Fe2+-dependent dioxygenase [Polyangiaceae bacterium]|nr:Fe2+-dependent dioxygenase [Polyangiaceae bacterium]